MPTTADELLTTGQVARVLGTSRQQIVNLCDRGELAFVKVGAHRRIKRSAVEALLNPSPQLTRDQVRSLWLHQAVAGCLVADPDAVLEKAVYNLSRLQQQHRNTMAQVWLDIWQRRLEGGVDAVLRALTSEESEAVELRQNSPFAGVLSQSQREKVLAAFAHDWSERTA